jgi:hypothetical protein
MRKVILPSGTGGHQASSIKFVIHRAYRPINERGERVTPSDFEAYRTSHDILGPCCLCPFQFQDTGEFKESAIFMMGHGRYAGEYVAACADGQCNYFSDELLNLQVVSKS